MHSGFKVLFIAFFQGIRGLFLCPYDHPGTISAASPCLQNSKRLSFTVPQDGMPGQPPLWGIWGGMCETFQLLLANFLRWSMLWYKELSAHEQTNRSSLIYIDGFCNSMKAHVEGLFPSSHCIQDLFLCCIKREMDSEEFVIHDCFKSQMRKDHEFKLPECLITKASCSPGAHSYRKQMPTTLVSSHQLWRAELSSPRMHKGWHGGKCRQMPFLEPPKSKRSVVWKDKAYVYLILLMYRYVSSASLITPATSK